MTAVGNEDEEYINSLLQGMRVQQDSKEPEPEAQMVTPTPGP